jgi:hypothetical protein
MKLKLWLAVAALAIFAHSGAKAAPIVYTGTVIPAGPTVNGLAGPFAVFDPFGVPLNETFFQFWSFTVPGTGPYQIGVTVHRLNNNLDPFLSLYRGLITPGTDTSSFDPFGSFDAVTYLASADDELPAAGPFGDPQLIISLAPGTYTVAIGGAASDCPGGCPANGYPYNLAVTVPEPSTLPLLSIAMLGIGLMLRRQGWTRRAR